jgi:hypothetical protein
VPDRDEWNRTAAHRFNRFMRDVRIAMVGAAAPRGAPAHAARIEYVRKAELQARGLLHYHVLAVEWGWLPWEVLQSLARKHGFGRTEVQRPKSVGAMSAYFVKHYLAKDGAALPVGLRAIVYSQGWPTVYRERSPDPVVVRRRVDWLGARESVESWSEVADRLGSPRRALPRRATGHRRVPVWEHWSADTWRGP